MRERCPRCFRPVGPAHLCGNEESKAPKTPRRAPRTRGRQSWADYLAAVMAPCGTRGAYRRGCRCDLCRAANAAYVAGRRQVVGR